MVVDTVAGGGGSVGVGGGGGGGGDRKSADAKGVVRIGMLDERYETQVTLLLLPFTFFDHLLTPLHLTSHAIT